MMIKSACAMWAVVATAVRHDFPFLHVTMSIAAMLAAIESPAMPMAAWPDDKP